MSYEAQLLMEELYSKRRINKLIEKELLSSSEMCKLLSQGTEALIDYSQQTYSYDTKNRRMEALRLMDMEQITLKTMVYLQRLCGRTEKLTALIGRLVDVLEFSELIDGVRTAAEIVAVLAHADLLDIDRTEDTNELLVVPRFMPSEEICEEIRLRKFLPPMVCEPRELKCNYSGGLLTEKESVILKKGNHHEYDVCLDHLNRLNRIPLALDLEFLKRFNDAPKKELYDPEQIEQWQKFQEDSYHVYLDLVREGNKFHMRHANDKRGRTYCRGYHVNYQGSEFKKSSINLYEKVFIDVPDEYRL